MGSVVAYNADGPHYWPADADAPVRLKDLGLQGCFDLVVRLINEKRWDEASEVAKAADYVVWDG